MKEKVCQSKEQDISQILVIKFCRSKCTQLAGIQKSIDFRKCLNLPPKKVKNNLGT